MRERTAALNARNAEMRLVLDNVAEGLMMTDREGRLLAERSAILERWFPEGPEDESVVLIKVVGEHVDFWSKEGDGSLDL